MDISAEASRKIRIFSFICALLVVSIHACYGFQETTFPEKFMNAITVSIKRFAVPYFFLVSGFFFDRGLAGRSASLMPTWKGILGKKTRTLLVPYLLWCAFGAIAHLPFLFFYNHVNHRPFFTGTCLGAGSLWETLDATFGIAQTPSWSPLWFVRLLLIFFILSPVWLLLRRFSRWMLLVAGIGLVFLGEPFKNFFVLGISGGGGIGWLLFGMAISAFRLEDRQIPPWGLWALFFLWIGACALRVFCPLGDRGALGFVPALLFFWGLYDVIVRHPTTLSTKMLEICAKGAHLSFFIYCCHLPLSQTITAALRFLFKTPIEAMSNSMSLVQSSLNFSVTLGLSLLLAWFLRRWFPKTYTLLMGGR